MTFDVDGADRRTATEILSHVIEKPEQADATFSIIAQCCQELMKSRTGCDMAELRSALEARGIALAAPPDFREDIDNLRAYSEHVRKQLADYETIKVADVQVGIEGECTNYAVKAACAGFSVDLLKESSFLVRFVFGRIYRTDHLLVL